MGNRISTDTPDSHMLVRDSSGKLMVYPYSMEEQLQCDPLPVPLSQDVQYLFLPSSNYQNKNYHTHLYYDKLCDTPGNDTVGPETVTSTKKNMNHIKYNDNSNSGYFQMKEEAINMPPLPKFYKNQNGGGTSQYAAKTAYNRCTPLPYTADSDNAISYQYNSVPMLFFTDDQCKNEYINPLSDPPDKVNGPFNVNNHSNDNIIHNMPYTIVTPYLNAASSTNATYYKLYSAYPA